MSSTGTARARRWGVRRAASPAHALLAACWWCADAGADADGHAECEAQRGGGEMCYWALVTCYLHEQVGILVRLIQGPWVILGEWGGPHPALLGHDSWLDSIPSDLGCGSRLAADGLLTSLPLSELFVVLCCAGPLHRRGPPGLADVLVGLVAKCTCTFVQLQFHFRILALRAEWRELQMSIMCFRLAAAMRSWLRAFFCKSSTSRPMDGHIDGGPRAWIFAPLFICQSAHHRIQATHFT
jgi:hypothetical protein